MARAFSGLGRARFSDLTDGVMRHVMARGEVRRSEVLSKFYRDIDSWTLEQIERVLSQMKAIEVIHLTEDDDILYKFTGAVEVSPLDQEASGFSEIREHNGSAQPSPTHSDSDQED